MYVKIWAFLFTNKNVVYHKSMNFIHDTILRWPKFVKKEVRSNRISDIEKQISGQPLVCYKTEYLTWKKAGHPVHPHFFPRYLTFMADIRSTPSLLSDQISDISTGRISVPSVVWYVTQPDIWHKKCRISIQSLVWYDADIWHEKCQILSIPSSIPSRMSDMEKVGYPVNP